MVVADILSNNEPTLERYQDRIERIFPFEKGEPKASVVIVTFGTPMKEVALTVDKIRGDAVEVLVINNDRSDGKNPFDHSDVTYVAMKRNAGVCVARNLGAVLARSNIVIFLDDDAIPGDDLVEAHAKEHLDPSVLAVRGRCLPKTHNLPNRIAFHYDLGSERIPSPIDLEGNSSFKRKELLACGGFNEDLPLSGGWEGVEVSRRLVQMSGDLSSVIYSPSPTIYHDYKSNSFQLLSKLLRHRRNLGQMSQGQEGLMEFFDRYPRQTNPLQKIKKAALTYR